ncbi:MAG: hypothetical protein GY794_26630, partial [bacterium]|nr:hypothetical protein [bacterium]
MIRTSTIFSVAMVSVIASLCCSAVKLVDDPPPAEPPKAGGIEGTITSRTEILSLFAVSRVTRKKYQPDSFTKKSGRFAFTKLPGDATYDLCLRLGDRREMEGVDLSFLDARLLSLASERRKQLSLPPERTHKFSQNDADQLLAYARDMKDFMEDRR